MSLLPRAALHSDSEQLYINVATAFSVFSLDPLSF
jgi:low affinity Fe/Cu permease